MYDERLVRAAQEGDEAAFAALYDRAIDSVYGLCWSLTGDSGEASRLVTDAFVLAAQNLGELSDPSQVRPWLLAIAADRTLSDDEEGVLVSGWPSPAARTTSDEPLGPDALRDWTAQAAAVLALPDQIVLELQLRHQLEGDQLAATIGSTPGGLPTVLQRVDEEAELVLGALVLARQGRRNCADLGRILRGWDGTPSVEVADKADAHAKTCERCRQRRGVVSPLDLVADAPLLVAPAAMRTPILEEVAPELAALAAAPKRPAPASTVTTAAVAAPPPRIPPVERDSPRIPTPALVGILAALVVLIVALVLIFRHPSKSSPSAAATTTTLADIAGPPATLAPIDTTTTPTTAPPASVLALNTGRVDLGANASSAQIVLSDTATTAATWSATTSASWLTVAPSSGSLNGNESTRVTISIDRTSAPGGSFDGKITFVGADAGSHSAITDVVGTNSATTTTTATSTTLGTNLTLSNVTATPSTVATAPCALQATTATVSATVTDPDGSPNVNVRYTLPDGSPGVRPMTNDGNGQYSATLPSSSTAGTINFVVNAIDGGASSRASGTVTVASCTGVH
jgi:DNA-directed RNA polymerase specialized sigma24 family protein